jgi:hypothetical protein
MGDYSNRGRPSSVTQRGKYEPFNLQVARNQIAYHSPIEAFGFSAAIGSTALGPMWEGQTQSGGFYTYPSSAAQLVLVSDSASDNTTRSIVINGLDANYAIQQEIIALNGTSNVTTTKSFLRINGMEMLNSTNTGNITASISSTVYAKINAGIGLTQMSIYTVPAGYTFYLSSVQVDASIGFTSSAYMTYAEYNKANSGTNNGQITVTQQAAFVQKQEILYTYPIAHIEKTDMQFCVKASAGGPLNASCYIDGILIADSA